MFFLFLSIEFQCFCSCCLMVFVWRITRFAFSKQISERNVQMWLLFCQFNFQHSKKEKNNLQVGKFVFSVLLTQATTWHPIMSFLLLFPSLCHRIKVVVMIEMGHFAQNSNHEMMILRVALQDVVSTYPLSSTRTESHPAQELHFRLKETAYSNWIGDHRSRSKFSNCYKSNLCVNGKSNWLQSFPFDCDETEEMRQEDSSRASLCFSFVIQTFFGCNSDSRSLHAC